MSIADLNLQLHNSMLPDFVFLDVSQSSKVIR